jgi:hypothetical protein
MKAFTSRVNATLPVDRPDHILLALVKGHDDRACGVACPAGQGLTGDGRCLPNAVIAGAARKSLQGQQRVTSLTTSRTTLTPRRDAQRRRIFGADFFRNLDALGRN